MHLFLSCKPCWKQNLFETSLNPQFDKPKPEPVMCNIFDLNVLLNYFLWFPSWSFMSYLSVPVFTQMYRIFSKNFELPLLSSSHCETCVDMGTNKSSWPSEESCRQHICLLHSRMHTWKWKINAASIRQCMALTYILFFKMILRRTWNFY